jgi:hypothetical protein
MRMSLSSKSGRFPPQFIPSFLALNSQEQAASSATQVQADAIASPPVAPLERRLHVDARLEMTQLDNNLCMFALHSRMNSKILSGSLRLPVGTQPTSEHLRAESKKLLLLCMQEASFRLQEHQDGFRWALVDDRDEVLASSEKIGDEALARATLRLITGQAARAYRTFDL